LEELKRGLEREGITNIREIGKKMNLYLPITGDNWDVSFDIKNEKYLIYEGACGYPKPITFLVVSDTHPIAKNEEELQTMDMKHYGGEKNRESSINKHRAKMALCNQMIEYIRNPSRNIYAVIMPGDNAGGFGKKSETEAFKEAWYSPLKNAFKEVGGNVWVGIGNHDCYWSSFFEPKPTQMLRFIKNIHGEYLYSFYIGNINFIHLGLHPCIGSGRLGGKYVNEVKDSLGFLKNSLKQIGNKTPVVIFFHYPTQGAFSDWWTKEEKEEFCNVIQNYNVILIAVGHAHSSAVFKSCDKFTEIRAAGNEFAEVKFDPQWPSQVEITFVDAEGKRRPVIKHMVTAGEMKDITPAPKPAMIGDIDVTETLMKINEGTVND